MTGDSKKLTNVDVQRLSADSSAESRAEVAEKVAAQFGSQELSAAERGIAEEIFRELMSDAEVRVREALAFQLKSSPDLPRDVALSLANDIDSVALPILEFCEVLSDGDLIEIVGGPHALKQEAIAKRKMVAAPVAQALIDTGNDQAVGALVENDGAELDEEALSRVIEDYQDSEAVSSAMSKRSDLPIAVSEQLMNVVAQQLKSQLANRDDIPEEAIRTLLRQVRDRATSCLLREGCESEEEVDALLAQLEANGRLSAPMLMEALSEGDLYFFEAGMARLVGIPIENARSLLHDKGELGLKSLLRAVA
ncbi:MAG: DUF2336 domain-containing protein [Pseudomonadota bacterium]